MMKDVDCRTVSNQTAQSGLSDMSGGHGEMVPRLAASGFGPNAVVRVVINRIAQRVADWLCARTICRIRKA